MKIASVADVKARFSAFLQETADGPIVVTRNGKAVAVLLAVQNDDEMEDLLLAHSPRLRAILEKSRKEISEGKGIGHADFWRQVEVSSSHGKPSNPEGKMASTGDDIWDEDFRGDPRVIDEAVREKPQSLEQIVNAAGRRLTKPSSVRNPRQRIKRHLEVWIEVGRFYEKTHDGRFYCRPDWAKRRAELRSKKRTA